MLAIKGKTDKPCVICNAAGDNRLAEDKKEPFLGSLCQKHLMTRTSYEVEVKKAKKGDDKETDEAEEQPQLRKSG